MKHLQKKRRYSETVTAEKKFRVPKNFLISGSLFISVLTTLIIYTSSFNFKYTNWDDPLYIHGNNCIKKLSAANVRKMFSEPAVLNYHPLTLLSLAIDYSRAGDEKEFVEKDPRPFHQTNIIFHLLNVILVFFFIYRLSGKKWFVAFLTAFLFGVHPMHVESVSWISGRKDVLFTFFFVGSLIMYLWYTEKRKIYIYFGALFLFVLSVLSKPAAAPMGMVLILLDYYLDRLPVNLLQPSTWKLFYQRSGLRILLEKLPFLSIGVVIIYITYEIQKKTAIADFGAFTVTQRLFFSTYGFCMYLIKLFVPANLSAFYPYPALSSGGYLPVFFYASLIISIVIVSLSILIEKRTKLLVFGVFFYLFMVILVLQFISVGGAIMSDRYSYVPYLGIFFILAMGVNSLIESQSPRISYLKYPLVVTTVFYMMAMTVVSINRTSVWKNSELLWTDVISKYPLVGFAHENRGIHYVSFVNHYDKALQDFLMAEQLGSKNPFVYKNQALIYAYNKDYEKSIVALNKQLKYDTADKQAYVNRGLNYANLKKYDEAFRDYDRAYKMDSTFEVLYTNRSFAYYETAQFKKAVHDYDWLILKHPEDEKYLYHRGLSKANLMDYKSALKDFNKCLSLNSSDFELYYNIGLCYFKLNAFAKSIEYLNKAKSGGFRVDESIYNLAAKQTAGNKSM